jgi:septal ring factor EnvC (AmiA/AmiB activator)
MRQSILEKVQAKQFQALAAVEDKILRKMREKEAEVEMINKKNADLEDQIKQLAMEVAAWQQRAKYNESMVSALKYNLDQVYKQTNDAFSDASRRQLLTLYLRKFLLCDRNKVKRDYVAKSRNCQLVYFCLL